MAENHEDIMYMLGEINGKLDKLDTIETKVDSMDGRLRTVETKAAIHGTVFGGLAAIGITLVREGVKSVTGGGGA